MIALLDLNDVSLSLLHGDRCVDSPGYAYLDEDRYQFGHSARAMARRHPRQVSTRYWAALDLQPLVPPLGHARHSADLVHGHLQAILEQQPAERLLLVAPGHMTREQLSLLLGVIDTLPTTASGLIHRSAAVVAGSGSMDGLHVDIQLQQTVVTPVSHSDNNAIAGDTLTLPGFGWLWLLDQLAGLVANQFIEQTRFDPQRRASSEQALFDALPALLAELDGKPETRLEIDGYSARIQAEQLAPAGQTWCRELARVAGGEHPRWLIDAPLRGLPGLGACPAERCFTGYEWRSHLLDMAADLCGDNNTLHLQTRCPRLVAANTTPTAAAPVTARPPTHLLIDHHATPLTDGLALAGDGCIALHDGRVTLGAPVAADLLVNGSPASAGQRLQTGDELSDSLGWVARLITVGD